MPARRPRGRIQARPRHARSRACHRRRGRVRDGVARTRRGVDPREVAQTIRQAAGRISVDSGEAGPHGHRFDRRAAARLSRGVGEGSRRAAGHPRSGDGKSVCHRSSAAHRRRRRADPGRPRRTRRPARGPLVPLGARVADLRRHDGDSAPHHRGTARQVRIVTIGGGPAALYFGILMKKADPSHEVTILERNRLEDTFGFGVVFSDATQNNLAAADPDTYDAMARHFAHWDNIDVHYRGQVITSSGHGFSGISRRQLLSVLGQRCDALGVCVEVGKDVKDVEAYRQRADLLVGADGFNSSVRERYAVQFQPNMDERPNRFVWLGTTRPFPAFTFYFKRDKHGLWRVHAYPDESGHSTFIVEATHATVRSAGMDHANEDQTVAFCEGLFKEELQGHRLLKNRSLWRTFTTVKNAKWSHDNVVLVGDAAHTAHFSVGSGTKLAIEDAIALAVALQRRRDLPDDLADYEAERRPAVESLQRAAQVSLQWFEDTERYMSLEPLQFALNLLTRSLRITHDNLKVRDPKFVESIDEWYATQAETQSRVPLTAHRAAAEVHQMPFVRHAVLGDVLAHRTYHY